jgi:hypothetical protein
MRFKATAFTHPEYNTLKRHSEAWAMVWGIGHLTFVIFLVVACSIPPALVAVALIVPETRNGLLNKGVSIVASSLLVAAIGLAVKKFARKRQKRSLAPTLPAR